MASRVVHCEIGNWTNAYGVANATYRLFDDDGDEQCDRYEILDTGEERDSGNPFETMVNGRVLKGGQSARIEDNYGVGRNWERNNAKFPGLLLQPATARHKFLDRTAENDGAGTGSLSIKFETSEAGQVSGRLTALGLRIETPNTGQTNHGVIGTQTISGNPALESKYESVAFVDVRNIVGWDAITDGGNRVKWGCRAYRLASVLFENSRLSGIRYEHSLYISNLRGPHRVRNHDAFWCQRTAYQILSRATEEDGIRGRGSIVVEDLRCRDCGLENDGLGAHTMILRSRHHAKSVVRRCQASQGNDPRVTPTRFSKTTGVLAQAWGTFDDYNEDGYLIPSDEVVWDNCIIVVGYMAVSQKTPAQFEGSTRRFTLSRCAIVTFTMNQLALDIVGYVNKSQAANFGERTLELFRCDIRNIVIGKVIFDDGIDRKEYPDFDMDGSGFAAFLADPYIQNHPNVELFDSEGGDDGDFRVNAGASNHRHAPTAQVTFEYPSGGGTQQDLEVSWRGINRHQASLSALEIEVPAITTNQQHAASAGVVFEMPAGTDDIDVRGTGRNSHTPSVEVEFEFVGGNPSGPVQVTSLATHAASVQVEFELPDDDGEGNLLLDLMPVGIAWPRAERESVRWALTKGWSEFLLRIIGRARDLVREADPRIARETLDRWRTLMGLPRDCMAQYSGISAVAREILVALYTLHGRGGTSAAKLEEICSVFGFSVTIEERQVTTFVAGRSKCGHRLVGSDQNLVFIVHAPEPKVRKLKLPFRCGDRLGVIEGAALRCILDEFKPAHTDYVIVYDLLQPCEWDDAQTWQDSEQWQECAQ